MNAKHMFLAAVAAACTALGSSGVWANQIPGDVVTGTITSVGGSESLGVQGHVYPIKTGSPAAADAPSLAPGQVVEVQLDGPAGSSSSHIIAVTPRNTGR